MKIKDKSKNKDRVMKKDLNVGISELSDGKWKVYCDPHDDESEAVDVEVYSLREDAAFVLTYIKLEIHNTEIDDVLYIPTEAMMDEFKKARGNSKKT